MTNHIIQTDALQEKMQSAAIQLIDVRSPAEFSEGHIPRAINIPLEEVPHRINDIATEGDVVITCASGARAKSCKTRDFADNQNVLVLEGGTNAWQKKGLPLVETSKAKTLPLMRQVQIGAGSFILIGFLLAWLLHPLWLGLPLFVGAGLLFAGVSGFCGMALILARMPWNQSGRTAAKGTLAKEQSCCMTNSEDKCS